MKPLIKRWLAKHSHFNGHQSGEIDSAFYDHAFLTQDEYHKPYWESRYYFAWTVLCDRLQRRGVRRILEIGCGAGQLAQMLTENHFSYTGFDFSPAAIEMARAKGLAGARFEVADATTTNLYELLDYDAVVCTEVLEHVPTDIGIIDAVKPGRYCICTVPIFLHKSRALF